MSRTEGVVRLCKEALDAIIENPRLTSTDATVFINLVRRVDVGRNVIPFIGSQFANSMGMPQKEVCESFQRLTHEGIVEKTRETGAPFYFYRIVYHPSRRLEVTESQVR